MKRLIALLLTLALLASCGTPTDTSSAPPTDAVASTEPAALDATGSYALDTASGEAVINDLPTAVSVEGNANVFYQIFVGSFSDSDGDGIGDLRGIIERMDYLNDGDPASGMSLGVEGIWLTPIFDSPSYHKYDVADYYAIDPTFGTEEDLKELIELCHERGVKVILDLVINHTSSEHPWFREFVRARQSGDTASEYYDFYTASDTPPGGRTFKEISGTDFYYECNFSDVMPELNFDNDAVFEAVLDVSKYYLELGVDGFRFDAAKYIYFGEETKNAEFWQRYMGELRAVKSDIYTVAEVWDSDAITYPYFASTNCFNFSMSQVNGQIAQAAKAGDVNVFTAYVARYIEAIKAQNPDALPVTFIANHDMDRAAGYLTLASGHAKVAASLSLLMPGSTFIYYGEEIGMKGSRGSANTDANRRLAMLWGDGDTVADPEGADYDAEQSNGTVATQIADAGSLYTHYKRLIAVRKANPAIAYGEYTPLNIAGMKLGGFVSEYEGNTVAVLHNTSMSAVEIDLATLDGVPLGEIAAALGVGSATLEGSVLTIDGQTSVVLK